ncbi:MAG: hypothetical protein JXL84_03475, partial [Deltaproteobacteria bacterium]|nr:hypothetical protein [Deltaproteobacteria bacterium]
DFGIGAVGLGDSEFLEEARETDKDNVLFSLPAHAVPAGQLGLVNRSGFQLLLELFCDMKGVWPRRVFFFVLEEGLDFKDLDLY